MSSKQLEEACAAGDVASVRSLLKNGADPCSFDDRGTSPLMIAAGSGHASIVDLLLLAGAPWNAQDKSGMCAGEHALQNEHAAVANQILDAGVRAELVMGAVDRVLGRPAPGSSVVSNREYLQQPLKFSAEGDQILDGEGEAVMMAWEKPLMVAHAEAVCSGGGHILNVGFGLGLIDEEISKRSTQSHTIIEAHPDVLKEMAARGWEERPGVTIVRGRWQDVIEDLGPFDGVFFDTYGEYYPDMREFHRHLPRLLSPGGIYSFFNGLAPDNSFFHAVYCQIVELEMKALGLETTFVPLPVDTSSKDIWNQVRHRYWWNNTYFLPVCQVAEPC